MTRQQIEAKIEAAGIAALHSLWVTALALLGALLIGAHRVGADDTPSHFWAFVHANYFQVLCVEIIAPGIRATVAAHTTAKGQTS